MSELNRILFLTFTFGDFVNNLRELQLKKVEN